MFGETILYFDTLASTNETAKDMAAGLPHGAVITALEQTAGKGRLGRVWQSGKDGGLYFSVVLQRAELGNNGELSGITQSVGIAVRRALFELTGLDEILLKWPNDVVIHGRKLAGILAETRSVGQGISDIICGIGINVNNDGFSRDLSGKAASLLMEKGRAFALGDVLAAVLRHMEDALGVFAERGFGGLMGEYTEHCVHFRGGGEITVKQNEVTLYTGAALGVTEDGGLVMVDNAGVRRIITSGEVSVR